VNPDIPGCDDKPVWDLWLSAYHLPAVSVADELKLFDTIAGTPGSATELASRTGCSERGLSILLPLLTALGFLVQRSSGYHLSPVARQYLLHDSPYYWGGLLSRIGTGLPQHRNLLELLRGVGDGVGISSAPGQKKPSDVWESGQLGLKQARQIATFMHSHSAAAAASAARNEDFKGVTRLLDVGGGSGCFAIALAQHHPDMRCSIMDLPAMCQVAQGYIDAAGAADSVDTVDVDMFRGEWPRGYDAVFFSNVFHDWSFSTCAQLAAKAFNILPSGGRIYLHEMLLDDDGAGPLAATAFSLVMLLGTQGQQFTFARLRDLLQGAGFGDIRVDANFAYHSLVCGIKP
jgi:hypothetical protein